MIGLNRLSKYNIQDKQKSPKFILIKTFRDYTTLSKSIPAQ